MIDVRPTCILLVNLLLRTSLAASPSTTRHTACSFLLGAKDETTLGAAPAAVEGMEGPSALTSSEVSVGAGSSRDQVHSVRS